jgi:lathosterol oxidase
MYQIIKIFVKLFSISLIRYFVIAGTPFLIFYVFRSERLINYKIQNRRARRKDFLREILHSLQTTSVLALLAYFVLYTPLRTSTQIYAVLSINDWWYLPISVMLALIAHDTYFYWMHRLLHHPKLFRRTHLLHHKSTNPSPWASYSFGMIEAWTEGFILIVVVLIIPMHPIGILSFTILSFVINVYGHLGYEIVPQKFRNSFLFKILNTSVHHNMHHSKLKGNYGLYFRIWDKLMGTEHPDYMNEFDRIQQQRFASNKDVNKNNSRSQ